MTNRTRRSLDSRSALLAAALLLAALLVLPETASAQSAARKCGREIGRAHV